MRTSSRRGRIAALLATVLMVLPLVALSSPVIAATPDGVSGPVIYQDGSWHIRTTPTSGRANLTFSFGRAGSDWDVPIVGDWDGDGDETVGIARAVASPPEGRFTWFLRNTNSSGPAHVTFDFGVPGATDFLRGVPIAGNLDPADDAYEVGYVLMVGDHLVWTIRQDMTPSSPEVSFVYGLSRTDVVVVGDWDGDGVDTAGVVRGNQWLLTNARAQGGTAQLSFSYGTVNRSIPEYKIVGDWNGDGVDTPGVLRNNPPTDLVGGFETWLVKNENTTGSADAAFTYGSDAFTFNGQPQSSPLFLPRLTIEVT
ncbi:hypothetical protein [Cryptosporangium minutisporangium]|uniref:VCBS repeat-containing protein n=1 Tax=Cryptosporangium minutisporangium TaxID=113569 RepID=A0ABP6T8H8_9ACTN